MFVFFAIYFLLFIFDAVASGCAHCGNIDFKGFAI